MVWEKNNKSSFRSIFIGVAVGLVVAGLFSTGIYVLATYQPGATLNPTCAPGADGCTVAAPLTNGFTGSFSGNGDLTTTGSFHVKNDNTYQYFGSTDQAKIYYNGSNLVLDPGGSGTNILTVGNATQDFYKLKFSTTTNPGMIIYTGSSKTFNFGNNDGNKILTTGLGIENSQGDVLYSLPVVDGSTGQFLKTNGSGTLSWGAPDSYSLTGAGLDGVFTGASGLLKKTGTATYTLDTSAYLTANQSISLSGDASGSGTTSISVTNNGLKGAALPTLATGLLKYTGSAWSFDNSAYLTGNQTITLGGILSGSGTTSITAAAASGYYMPSTTDQTNWNAKQATAANLTSIAGLSSITNLTNLAGLANSAGVLTNNGSGTLTWAAASGVPYTGANDNVNLGTNNITAAQFLDSRLVGYYRFQYSGIDYSGNGRDLTGGTIY